MIRNNADKKKNAPLSLVMAMSAVIFVIMAISITLVVLLLVQLLRTGVIQPGYYYKNYVTVFLGIAAASVIIGTILSVLAGKIIMISLNKIIGAMNALASGDYKTRLHPPKIWRAYKAVGDFTESFNTMASELEHTEILRSDFINNFSHEFKTPIVSISGFAKLLRSGDLTPDEQKEYAGIIESESHRLATLATNILNLTKIENQEILTDVSTYNLSEQIRETLLVLEKGWSEKELELELEFGEYDIRADKKLMEQVWLNILGNAVKFSKKNGLLRVNISIEADSSVRVDVTNTGSSVKPENYEKIFTKYYQEDASHSVSGNGIGLSLVKRICDLHAGSVSVVSENNETTFTVVIPQ